MRFQNIDTSVRLTDRPAFDRVRVPVTCAVRGGWTIHVPRAGDPARRPDNTTS